MAYKNVYTTFKNLHNLGLIERVTGRFKHGAKPYRLSSLGLFQVLLLPIPLPVFLIKYQENFILRDILFRFFEVETLRLFLTPIRAVSLTRYLKKCCEAILREIEKYRRSKIRQKDKYFLNDINDILRSEIRNFIFELVINTMAPDAQFRFTKNNSEYSRLVYLYGDPKLSPRKSTEFSEIDVTFTFEDERNSKYEGFLPRTLLARDQKFVTELNSVKKEFLNACNEIMKHS